MRSEEEVKKMLAAALKEKSAIDKGKFPTLWHHHHGYECALRGVLSAPTSEATEDEKK